MRKDRQSWNECRATEFCGRSARKRGGNCDTPGSGHDRFGLITRCMKERAMLAYAINANSSLTTPKTWQRGLVPQDPPTRRMTFLPLSRRAAVREAVCSSRTFVDVDTTWRRTTTRLGGGASISIPARYAAGESLNERRNPRRTRRRRRRRGLQDERGTARE